ncbi:hypothetical protein VaNZ11_007636 [Volvox africanus]|uniref:DNA2/NAM7 helicase-like C-terminal domain-containing protein n=1 Tax=Volvox africanus TaxID=51714 RepID=A0ABQ5S3D7_9CHLO|nr:hypothetical protein VaNZ11_007636 [Volvox africanus]
MPAASVTVLIPTAPAGGSEATIQLSVTDVASFVGLRQCGRYLRLTVARNAPELTTDTQDALNNYSVSIDGALAAAGRQLEVHVAEELERRAPDAPYVNPCRPKEACTPWLVFLDLLARAPNPSSGYLGCWAAEVVLRGRPAVDSVLSLSGRADYIVLLWRSGRPVLRIVECKASTEPQTKYIVQLVLYRMLLLRLLSEAAAANNHRECVCIGGLEWSVPGRRAVHGVTALEVECLLRTKLSGPAGHATDGDALPMEEVEAMTRQLSGMLMPGGRIAEALSVQTPLVDVPYELDGHCGACSRVAQCWIESAARGAVQLSGCSASEAQRLAKAGVTDIEELAALLPPSNGALPAPPRPGPTRPRRLEDVAADSDIAPGELHRLSLIASVRTRRWLGHALSLHNEPGWRQQWSTVQLLPGAPPSGLPSFAVRSLLVRVYLSVSVDVALRRVVGVAAHIAAPDLSSGSAEEKQTAPPSQAAQTGWDVAILMEGVTLEDSSSSAVANTDMELDDMEAQLLADFSDQLCEVIQQCVERQQQQAQQLMLHFYIHSHEELTELIRRCNTLEHLHGLRRSSDALTAHSLVNDKSCAKRFGRGSGSSYASASGSSIGAASGTGLGWLPHLLGLRADIGDFQEKAGMDASPEQAMVSVIEDEIRRYATAWHGAGRLAATSVAWGSDRTIFNWRAPQPLRHTRVAMDGGAAAADAIPGSEAAKRSSSSSRLEGDADGDKIDLRAAFAPGGYLNSLVRDSRDLRSCAEAVAISEQQWTQRSLKQQGQARQGYGIPPADPQPRRRRQPESTPAFASGNLVVAQLHDDYVQVRPDLAGSSIPPGFFRALWASSSGLQRGRRDETQSPQQPEHRGEQQQHSNETPSPGRCHGNSDAVEKQADIFQRGASSLRSLLLAQAHAVRWLEERLARLPDGGNPCLRKVPLVLPQPLGRSLRAFQLDVGNLPGGPRRAPQGPQAERAIMLARAALDTMWLNRGGEIRQFWQGLGLQAPAARAADNRNGTVVLDRLRRMNEGKVHWLLGRVAAPESCRNWEALTEATRLEEGSRVVVTAVPDPSVCQDPCEASGRYAHGVITSVADSGLGNGTGSVEAEQELAKPVAGHSDLWVECRLDKTWYPTNGLFLSGTPRVWPWTFAVGGAASGRVALDAAPNISAWVATSVIEILQEFGGSSAYLAERLWLSLPPADLAAGSSFMHQWLEAASEGTLVAREPETGPNTPLSEVQVPGDIQDRSPNRPCPRDTATPATLLRGHEMLTHPQSSTSSNSILSAHARGLGGGSAGSADSTGPSNVTRGRAGGSGDDLVQRLAPELDQDQKACIYAFLKHPESGSRVLLQGPPGTGKTETVAAALLVWLAERMHRGGPMGPSEQGGVVLLTGPTHAAVDNIMKRIGVRLRNSTLSGDVLRGRSVLVRLDSDKKALDLSLADLGVQSSLPNRSSWQKNTWYLVGGTLRYLAKAAKQLRTLVASAATPQAAKLMEASGRAAFASALLMDEASMVFAPQLLALGCLLVARGSLLVAGDHQQLSTITNYDFEGDQRPNLLRHRPYVSAYEYVRLMQADETVPRRGQRQEPPEGHLQWIGGPPPPVSTCALSYTHRLPYAVRALIQPLYSRDGIILRGRPPAERPAADNTNTTITGSSKNSSAVTTRNNRASRFAARPTVATGTASLAATSTLMAAPFPLQRMSGGGSFGGVLPEKANAGGVWRHLWQGPACEEGVFLLVHNETGSSRCNDLEVQLVASVLEARLGSTARLNSGTSGELATADGSTGLIASSISGSSGNDRTGDVSVAIITPHRSQRRALKALVEERGWGRNCQVDTVERMQGGEAEIVIFSATASDAATLERSEEFYSSVCRANVAFSRARQRLIVVASRAFLEQLPTSYSRYSGLMLWRQLRAICQDRGAYLGAENVQMWLNPQARAAAAAATGAAAAGGQLPGGDSADHSGGGQHELRATVTYRCDVYRTVA